VFRRICAAESAIRKYSYGLPESQGEALLARTEFDPALAGSKVQLIVMDRVAQMGLIAAQRAVEAAGVSKEDLADAGIYVGCALGGSQTIEDSYQVYFEKRSRKHKPTTVPRIMPNATAGQISLRYGIRGESLTYSVACASSGVAIGEALLKLRSGRVSRAIAGGAEAFLNDATVAAWENLTVLAKEHPDGPQASCRPFSLDRTGLVLGEGSAMMVLETGTAMRARGATPIAEIVGYGTSSDAHNITLPSAEGQARALKAALADAAIEPGRVGYANAHATATQAGDKVEIDALKRVFGDKPASFAVSSTKSMHGHLMGAAGAMEFAVTVLALKHRRLPPTANLGVPDPDCDLDCVPNVAREAPDLEYALSNSFAFGGANAVLIAKRAD
jgi:3-oxoacyl-[acyl-carrier-protein] synthase II